MSQLKLIAVRENLKLYTQTSQNKSQIVESFDKISKTQMWSLYQGFSYLGGKFSHVEGKPSI